MREPNRQAQERRELAEHSNKGILATGTTLGPNLGRARLNSQLPNYRLLPTAPIADARRVLSSESAVFPERCFGIGQF